MPKEKTIKRESKSRAKRVTTKQLQTEQDKLRKHILDNSEALLEDKEDINNLQESMNYVTAELLKRKRR